MNRKLIIRRCIILNKKAISSWNDKNININCIIKDAPLRSSTHHKDSLWIELDLIQKILIESSVQAASWHLFRVYLRLKDNSTVKIWINRIKKSHSASIIQQRQFTNHIPEMHKFTISNQMENHNRKMDPIRHVVP